MLNVLSPIARKNLEKLLASSKPVKSMHFAKIIEAEFGVACSDIFKTWDNEVYATGSIGQVFKAQLHTGEMVAVKVKYPKIEQRVLADFAILNIFMWPIRVYFRKYNVVAIVNYIKNAMYAECDLIQEAKNYENLAKVFSNQTDLIIPKVYKKFCSARVLTNEFFKGSRISEVIPSLNTEEKERLDRLIKRFYFYPIGQYNIIQIDPHLGNFLYSDGKVVCIDFGGLHRIRPEIAQVFNDFLKYTRDADVLKLFELFESNGLIDPKLVNLAIFTKYMAYAMIDPFGCKNSQGINNLNYYFRNYSKEPLRSGVVTKMPDLPVFIITYFVFRNIESRLLAESRKAAKAAS